MILWSVERLLFSSMGAIFQHNLWSLFSLVKLSTRLFSQELNAFLLLIIVAVCQPQLQSTPVVLCVCVCVLNVCGEWRKISKSHHDLDLGPTMPQIELVQAIFIYYNVFYVFLLSYRTHPDTHTNTHIHKPHTHTQSFSWVQLQL